MFEPLVVENSMNIQSIFNEYRDITKNIILYLNLIVSSPGRLISLTTMTRRKNTFFNCRNCYSFHIIKFSNPTGHKCCNNQDEHLFYRFCRPYPTQVIWTRRNRTTMTSRADRKERVFHDCCRSCGGNLGLCIIEVHLSLSKTAAYGI